MVPICLRGEVCWLRPREPPAQTTSSTVRQGGQLLNSDSVVEITEVPWSKAP